MDENPLISQARTVINCLRRGLPTREVCMEFIQCHNYLDALDQANEQIQKQQPNETVVQGRKTRGKTSKTKK